MTGWYKWQLAYLKDYLISLPKDEIPIFTDDSLSLFILEGNSGKTLLETGRLILYHDRLEFVGGCNRFSFLLKDISKMSLVLRGKLFFTVRDNYYEITGKHEYCALKYLISYKFLLGKNYI